MSLPSDRAELRQRWYGEGFFGAELIADHLRQGAAAFPGTAMHFVGGPTPTSIQLGAMYDRSLRLAGGLAKLGIRPGDVVAIWVPNWLEGALTTQAAMMLGATVVPIIHIYGSHEAGFILRQSGARVLVLPDRWRNIDYQERFDAITDVPALEDAVLIGEHGPAGAIPWSRLAGADVPSQLPTTHPPGRQLSAHLHVGHHGRPERCAAHRQHVGRRDPLDGGALGEREGVNLAAFPAGHIAGVLGLLCMFALASPRC